MRWQEWIGVLVKVVLSGRAGVHGARRKRVRVQRVDALVEGREPAARRAPPGRAAAAALLLRLLLLLFLDLRLLRLLLFLLFLDLILHHRQVDLLNEQRGHQVARGCRHHSQHEHSVALRTRGSIASAT